MGMIVGDIISEEKATIYAVPAGLTVVEAAKKMVKRHVGCLIVKQASSYAGIITERDVTRCMATSKQPHKALVEDFMSTDIQFITPNDTMEYAAQVMRTLDFRHLPVSDGGVIMHILSIRDITFADLPELEIHVKDLIMKKDK